MKTVTTCRTGLYGSVVLRNYHDTSKDHIVPPFSISLTAVARTSQDYRRAMERSMQLTTATTGGHRERAHPPACREGRA